MQLAPVLVALGVILLVRCPRALSVAGAIGCFFGAGLAIFLGEEQVGRLRHEVRYEDEEVDRVTRTGSSGFRRHG